MAKNVKYPIVAPPKLIEMISHHLFEGGWVPTNLEELFPGITKAIERLNVRTGCCSKEELFAGWDVPLRPYDGRITVDSVLPQYIRGRKKSFVYDGKNFV